MFWPMSVPPAHWDGWDWNQPSGSLLKSLNVICVFRSSLSLLRDKPGAESSRLGRAEWGIGTLLAEDMLIQTSALFSAACRLWEYTSSHQSSETSKTEASPLGSPHLSLSLSLPPQGEARIGGFPFAHSTWSQKDDRCQMPARLSKLLSLFSVSFDLGSPAIRAQIQIRETSALGSLQNNQHVGSNIHSFPPLPREKLGAENVLPIHKKEIGGIKQNLVMLVIYRG